MNHKFVIYITDTHGNIMKFWVDEFDLYYWVDEFKRTVRDILLIRLGHDHDDKVVKYYDGELNSLTEEDFLRRAKAYKFRKDFL